MSTNLTPGILIHSEYTSKRLDDIIVIDSARCNIKDIIRQGSTEPAVVFVVSHSQNRNYAKNATLILSSPFSLNVDSYSLNAGEDCKTSNIPDSTQTLKNNLPSVKHANITNLTSQSITAPKCSIKNDKNDAFHPQNTTFKCSESEDSFIFCSSSSSCESTLRSKGNRSLHSRSTRPNTTANESIPRNDRNQNPPTHFASLNITSHESSLRSTRNHSFRSHPSSPNIIRNDSTLEIVKRECSKIPRYTRGSNTSLTAPASNYHLRNSKSASSDSDHRIATRKSFADELLLSKAKSSDGICNDTRRSRLEGMRCPGKSSLQLRRTLMLPRAEITLRNCDPSRQDCKKQLQGKQRIPISFRTPTCIVKQRIPVKLEHNFPANKPPHSSSSSKSEAQAAVHGVNLSKCSEPISHDDIAELAVWLLNPNRDPGTNIIRTRRHNATFKNDNIDNIATMNRYLHQYQISNEAMLIITCMLALSLWKASIRIINWIQKPVNDRRLNVEPKEPKPTSLVTDKRIHCPPMKILNPTNDSHAHDFRNQSQPSTRTHLPLSRVMKNRIVITKHQIHPSTDAKHPRNTPDLELAKQQYKPRIMLDSHLSNNVEPQAAYKINVARSCNTIQSPSLGKIKNLQSSVPKSQKLEHKSSATVNPTTKLIKLQAVRKSQRTEMLLRQHRLMNNNNCTTMTSDTDVKRSNQHPSTNCPTEKSLEISSNWITLSSTKEFASAYYVEEEPSPSNEYPRTPFLNENKQQQQQSSARPVVSSKILRKSTFATIQQDKEQIHQSDNASADSPSQATPQLSSSRSRGVFESFLPTYMRPLLSSREVITETVAVPSSIITSLRLPTLQPIILSPRLLHSSLHSLLSSQFLISSSCQSPHPLSSFPSLVFPLRNDTLEFTRSSLSLEATPHTAKPMTSSPSLNTPEQTTSQSLDLNKSLFKNPLKCCSRMLTKSLSSIVSATRNISTIETDPEVRSIESNNVMGDSISPRLLMAEDDIQTSQAKRDKKSLFDHHSRIPKLLSKR